MTDVNIRVLQGYGRERCLYAIASSHRRSIPAHTVNSQVANNVAPCADHVGHTCVEHTDYYIGVPTYQQPHVLIQVHHGLRKKHLGNMGKTSALRGGIPVDHMLPAVAVLLTLNT